MCSLEKRDNLWILTITSDDQNRLNLTLIESLLSTVTNLASQSTPGSVLITTAKGKFFSNGFDLPWALAAGSKTAAAVRLQSMVDSLKPVAAVLISLPMPTIAAINGHASAAGLLLAMCHDYVMMRSDRGVLYMPEVDLGLPLPDYFTAVMKEKIKSPAVLRDVLLAGVKIKGKQAVEMGVVDSAHGSGESVTEAAVRLGGELAQKKWVGKVYAEIRKSLYPDTCKVLGLTPMSLSKM